MFKKYLIKTTISIISFLFGNKKIKVDRNNKILVNLGCGLRCLPGWINVDGSLTAFFGSKKNNWINKILYRLAGSSAYYTFVEFNEIIKKCALHFYDLRKGAPFNKESVDIIFTSHFLEHLNKSDGRNFIKECYRVLNGGGINKNNSAGFRYCF